MIKRNLIIFAITFSVGFSTIARADEGMWLVSLINQMNYGEMKKMGLKLSPEQLYDINNACMKDAIARIDYGNCTGEIISAEGLMLTNHHCGYGEIQNHSTIDHDYLTNGFWAMNKQEELPNPGKVVSFLVRVEDVTSKILKDIKDNATEQDREKIIGEATAKIIEEAEKGTTYEASVESMLGGNEYYLFLYETFTDIRLVGAPPESIGKFGGDTDNWMWPRHTGDFCIFRVYSGPDGKPAEYSKDNVPYKPKHFLPISMKGVAENDFAMIWGYPGSTDRYLPSYGVKEKIELQNPVISKVKEEKLDAMRAYMDADPKVRIQYASKYAYIANFWKKAIEETKSLKKLKVYDSKKEAETQFVAWLNAEQARKTKYANVIPMFDEAYDIIESKKLYIGFWHFIETMQDVNVVRLSLGMRKLNQLLEEPEKNKDVITKITTRLKDAVEKSYEEYYQPLDKTLMALMLNNYAKNVPEDQQPDVLITIQKKYKGSYEKYTDYVYSKSIFATKEKYLAFLEKPNKKQLQNDPGFVTMVSLLNAYIKTNTIKAPLEEKLSIANRLYIAGLREMQTEKNFYPDANSTMRCTYGKVESYSPGDAIEYSNQTYLKGVMEKEDPTKQEFVVPSYLKELYKTKNFGRYAQNGDVPVAFLTNNDITGGNSGSPVINGNGELIGTAFDGNSEAMSCDIKFNDELQRTIVCDIRYVLFVVDKYAGAGYLLNEMKIVE